jgi:hypothetical protein
MDHLRREEQKTENRTASTPSSNGKKHLGLEATHDQEELSRSGGRSSQTKPATST